MNTSLSDRLAPAPATVAVRLAAALLLAASIPAQAPAFLGFASLSNGLEMFVGY